MKLIFILGCLALGAWWGFGKVKEAYFMEDGKKALAKLTPGKPADPVPPSGNPLGALTNSIGKGLDPGAAPKKPITSKVFKFRNRELPAADFVAGLNVFGVEALLDPLTRSMLIRGPFDSVEAVSSLLSQSDEMPGACAVRGWVLFVNDNQVQGWDLVPALSEISETKITGHINTQGLVLDIGIDKLSAALDVLKTDTAITLMQEPHVRLLDGTESRIESLEEVPIPTTVVSQGLATQSIEYKKVGLEMILKPRFLPGERVRLDVVQIGGLVGRSIEFDGVSVPVLQTQRVSASVECSIGQTVVMGGLRTTRTRQVKGFLSDSQETESGTLYVILALYSDIPKAQPVEAPEWLPDLDHMVLPPLDILPGK